jgi:putative glutamine amidotransferase
MEPAVMRALAGSLLERALGPQAAVNSYHHPALDALGHGIRPVAWAPDGIVEAIEVHTASAVCIGVEWQLQESWQTDTRFLDIFRLQLHGGKS